MTETKGADWKTELKAVIALCVTIAFFGYLSFVCFVGMLHGVGSLGWPSVTGTINGYGNKYGWIYTYRVGRDYESSHYRYGPHPPEHSVLHPHFRGEKVPVYYCPGDPGTAVLERGLSLQAVGLFGASFSPLVFFLFVGLPAPVVRSKVGELILWICCIAFVVSVLMILWPVEM